jgi:hypothetical protein
MDAITPAARRVGHQGRLRPVFDGAMGAWHNANRNNRSPMAPCRRARGQYVPGGERVGTARKNAPLPTLRCWSL